MVVMCPLHLAIFLEISGAVAFLHSLLMRLIVVSDKVADAILIFLLLPALPCNVFKCAYLDVYYFLLLSGTFNLLRQVSLLSIHTIPAHWTCRVNFQKEIEFLSADKNRGKDKLTGCTYHTRIVQLWFQLPSY